MFLAGKTLIKQKAGAETDPKTQLQVLPRNAKCLCKDGNGAWTNSSFIQQREMMLIIISATLTFEEKAVCSKVANF